VSDAPRAYPLKHELDGAGMIHNFGYTFDARRPATPVCPIYADPHPLAAPTILQLSILFLIIKSLLTIIMTYSLDPKPNPLADDPPVAATPGGGPNESPGLLVKPRNFVYEVSQLLGSVG